MSKNKKITTPADRILEQQKRIELVSQAQSIAYQMSPVLVQAMQVTIPQKIETVEFAMRQAVKSMALYEHVANQMAWKLNEIYKRIHLSLQPIDETMKQISHVLTLAETRLNLSTQLIQHSISQASQALQQAIASNTEIENKIPNISQVLMKYLVIDSFQENAKMGFTEQLLDSLKPYIEEVEKKSKESTEKSNKEVTNTVNNDEALLLQREGNKLAQASLQQTQLANILAVIALILSLIQFFNDEPQVKVEIHNHINQVIIEHSDYDSYDVDLEKIIDNQVEDFNGGQKS